MNPRLPPDFFLTPDVTAAARALLGQRLCCTGADGTLCTGIITETEAYAGQDDRACHAWGGRRTGRNEVMYHTGGAAYVYLCYGIHHLFNVVTNVEGRADAVLVRAVQPEQGIDTMLARRGMVALHPRLTAGPGALTAALGIRTSHSGANLADGNQVWLEAMPAVPADQIAVGTRIGVDYAGADALKPWRYLLAGSQWISRKP